MLDLAPAEGLIFSGVHVGKAYTQQLTISNNTGAGVQIAIICGSSTRFTVQPASCRIAAGSSAVVNVTLKLLKPYGQPQKAIAGVKETFNIKARPRMDRHSTFAPAQRHLWAHTWPAACMTCS
jgi:hypothetical protein